MALNILEFFGYDPRDASPEAIAARQSCHCPFLRKQCTKTLNDGTVSGACTMKAVRGTPVVTCPIRLYAGEYKVLRDIAGSVFGEGLTLVPGHRAAVASEVHPVIAVFGKRWGKELKLPTRAGRGAYFVDWILAHVLAGGELESFVAVEVQSLDTTGNYRAERDAYIHGDDFSSHSPAGLNWENVNKRILPQIIYKGHVLRREPLCTKGMFFVSPGPVYERIMARLGSNLLEYGLQPGSLTFRCYDPGPSVPPGHIRELVAGRQFTTTVDQVAYAFVSPADLPDPCVYENAIRRELGR